MVVMRKKDLVRMGKASGPTKSDNPSQVRAKGNLDLSQTLAHVEAGEILVSQIKVIRLTQEMRPHLLWQPKSCKVTLR